MLSVCELYIFHTCNHDSLQISKHQFISKCLHNQIIVRQHLFHIFFERQRYLAVQKKCRISFRTLLWDCNNLRSSKYKTIRSRLVSAIFPTRAKVHRNRRQWDNGEPRYHSLAKVMRRKWANRQNWDYSVHIHTKAHKKILVSFNRSFSDRVRRWIKCYATAEKELDPIYVYIGGRIAVRDEDARDSWTVSIMCA